MKNKWEGQEQEEHKLFLQEISLRREGKRFVAKEELRVQIWGTVFLLYLKVGGARICCQDEGRLRERGEVLDTCEGTKEMPLDEVEITGRKHG